MSLPLLSFIVGTMKNMGTFLRRYPCSILCIALIWYLCMFKPPRTQLSEVQNFDKVVHISMYLGTCLTIWWEYLRSHVRRSWPRLVCWAIIAPILMSGIIELAQAYLTTTRSGDWFDFLANSVGVVLAALIGSTLLYHHIHTKF